MKTTIELSSEEMQLVKESLCAFSHKLREMNSFIWIDIPGLMDKANETKSLYDKICKNENV